MFLNVAATLNKAFTKITDNSAATRVLSVTWFSEVARDILNEPRKWHFLEQTTTLAIVDNQITLPATCGEIVNIQVGNLLFTPADQMSDTEAFEYTGDSNIIPIGYTLSADGVVTFIPGAEGNATLKYEVTLNADYTDVNTDTIFPLEFENVFITGVRAHFYDNDKDGRYQKEELKYQTELAKMRAADNNRKASLRLSRHGYRGTV